MNPKTFVSRTLYGKNYDKRHYCRYCKHCKRDRRFMYDGSGRSICEWCRK